MSEQWSWTMSIDSCRKLYYIIVYEGGMPFLSIATYSKRVNKKKIIADRKLYKDVVIRVEEKDRFIGW